MGLKDTELIPVLSKAIQEQQAEIEALKAQVATLQARRRTDRAGDEPFVRQIDATALPRVTIRRQIAALRFQTPCPQAGRPAAGMMPFAAESCP